jgi:aspartate racemase
MTDTKTVGVIGGLGPYATLDFFERVLNRTRAQHEQDHLRLIIDNNTRVPDRNAFMRGDGPSPAPALAASAKGLQDVGADFIVMACNTTHAW